MNPRRLRTSLNRLDVTRKWLLLSVGLVAMSTLMPWYEDVDVFGAGDRYLGVTGPLFLVGLMVLATSAFVAAWIVLPAMGRRVPTLPFKESAIFMFLGVQDLLLLLIANSVFFHPKFGVNITLKNTRFGMILAFAGVLLMLWSSYRLYNSEQRRYSMESSERAEPLIKMPEPLRDHGMAGTYRRPESSGTLSHRPDRLERVLKDSDGSDTSAQPLRMDL